MSGNGDEISVEPGRVLAPLSDNDWALLVQWMSGRELNHGNLAWIAVQILDLIYREGGDDAIDVLLAVIDSRYMSGRGRES